MLDTIFKNKLVSFKRDKINDIIFINCLKKDFTSEEISDYHKAYLKMYDKFEKKDKKVFLIFDISCLGMNCIKFAKYEGEFLNTIKKRTEKIVHATCTITSSSLIKNAFNMYIKIYGDVVPSKIVYDIEEAILFINKLGILENRVEYHT